MESSLVKLKSDFNNIINIRNSVKNVFDILQIRIDRLSQIYGEFIKNNKNEMFVFGLDSFHFQSKLIDIEYEDMKRLFLAINNRMYCEYFKLHKMIVVYISENINDRKNDMVKINSYPIYKDLEPFKEYNFEVILDIHENILNLLGILISLLNNKENELSIHKTKQTIGLNIDNFITSFNFNINVMREKILMYITHIEFFHKMHTKYLKRFSNKIQLMYTHISNDIKFDDAVEISKNKRKELIDDFNTNNVDKNLLKDLKTSIGSETSSEISSIESKSVVSMTLDNITNFISQMSPKENNNNLLENKDNLEGRKDYKKIFQKNVKKVSNVLQLCKPKNTKVLDPKLSDSEINNLFFGINQSCDSLLNNEHENISDDNKTLSSSRTTSLTEIAEDNTVIENNINISDANGNLNYINRENVNVNIGENICLDPKPTNELINKDNITLTISEITSAPITKNKKKNKKKKK